MCLEANYVIFSYSQRCPLSVLFIGALQYKIASVMVVLFSFNGTTDTVSLDNV